MNNRREHIIGELISSESNYLTHLNLILKFFFDPLQCSRVIDVKEVNMIFGDVRSIRLVNQVLFDHFVHNEFFGAFSQLVHFLKLYSSYARNFPSSQSTLNRLMETNVEFRRFVEKQENNPNLTGLKLPALLITPIQRIPRYKLLLEQLFEVTDENADEKVEIGKVLRQLTEIAELINSCVEDFENSTRIVSVQKSLDKCTPKLLVPGRKLIKEGKLTKISSNGAVQHQTRHFWLFTDLLLYAKANPRKSNAFLCCGVFPLRHCFVERLMGQNLFRIACKSENLLLRSDEYSILDEWVNGLETAIKNLTEARKTLRKESSSSNPLRRGFLKNRRRCSSLSEKWRSQCAKSHPQAPAVVLRNNNTSYLQNVRRRLLKFVHRRNTQHGFRPNPPNCAVQMKKPRRNVARSPILSLIEEEELKRASLTDSPANTSSIERCDLKAGGDEYGLSTSSGFGDGKHPWWATEIGSAPTAQCEETPKKNACRLCCM